MKTRMRGQWDIIYVTSASQPSNYKYIEYTYVEIHSFNKALYIYTTHL